MSQDSILGQSISGYRALDIPLNVLGAVGALRSGQLGQLAALQGIRRAQEQEAQYQLPQLRAQALQSPEVREQLRLEGPGGQTAQAYGLRGPAIPSAAAMLTGGRTGPEAQAQLQQVAARGQAAGMPSDTPAATMTNDAVERLYKLANAQRMGAEAQRMQAMQGMDFSKLLPPGMVTRGATIDPMTGEIKITAEVPGVRQVDPGTMRPDGKPYKPGDTGPRGEPIEVKPVRGAGIGAIQIGAQMKRIDAALQQVDQLLTPRKLANGQTMRAIDVLPDFSGAGSIPGLNPAARSGVLGSIPVPGGNVGDAYLRNIANDTTDPRSPLASDVLSSRGAIVNIVKAFGDAANIADAEQERLIQAFLPAFGNSPGAGGSAEQKLQFLKTSLSSIQQALKSGDIKTAGELRTTMSQVFGTPLGARPEDDPKFRDDGAPIAASEGGAKAPAAAPLDPDVEEALKRLGGQ